MRCLCFQPSIFTQSMQLIGHYERLCTYHTYYLVLMSACTGQNWLGNGVVKRKRQTFFHHFE